MGLHIGYKCKCQQNLVQQGTLSRGPVEGTGRRVPGQRPSLTDRQREYVRAKRSKGWRQPGSVPLGRHGWKPRFMPPRQDCHIFDVPAKSVYARASILVATNLPFRPVHRSPQLGASHRRAAGPAHPPRPHPGDERRELPPQAQPGERRVSSFRRSRGRIGHTANAVSSCSCNVPTPTNLLPSVITSVVHDLAAPVAQYLGAIDSRSRIGWPGRSDRSTAIPSVGLFVEAPWSAGTG